MLSGTIFRRMNTVRIEPDPLYQSMAGAGTIDLKADMLLLWWRDFGVLEINCKCGHLLAQDFGIHNNSAQRKHVGHSDRLTSPS